MPQPFYELVRDAGISRPVFFLIRTFSWPGDVVYISGKTKNRLAGIKIQPFSGVLRTQNGQPAERLAVKFPIGSIDIRRGIECAIFPPGEKPPSLVFQMRF